MRRYPIRNALIVNVLASIFGGMFATESPYYKNMLQFLKYLLKYNLRWFS